ncbi:MAG TPA: PfkB family carbohydrate kinase [Vicinamibacterales bacterium]|nr:PfkB family carbohydrate kinase [Vicinamibacterales bacterium]
MRLPLALPSPTDRAVDAAALGENSLDLLVVVPEHPRRNSKQKMLELTHRPGGQCATAMVACARLGWRARYVGHFGDDPNGQSGIESLRQEGVDVDYARTIAGATSQTAVILVDASTHDRTVIWHRHPALAMGADDVRPGAVTGARVLLVDGQDPPAATRAAAIARRAGTRTVIDIERVRPGTEALLKEIDIIIASEAFPPELTGIPATGAALRAMFDEFRPTAACVTLGEAGSLAVCDGREIQTPAFRVDVVDTTGAGDAFRGGFIAGWLKAGDDTDLDEALRYASAVAAMKCRVLGAREGLPRDLDVEAFLADHPRKVAAG